MIMYCETWFCSSTECYSFMLNFCEICKFCTYETYRSILLLVEILVQNTMEPVFLFIGLDVVNNVCGLESHVILI